MANQSEICVHLDIFVYAFFQKCLFHKTNLLMYLVHDEDSSDESTFESDESGGPHGEREGSSKLTRAGTVFWVGVTAVVTPLRERDISSKVSLKESKSGRLEGLI